MTKTIRETTVPLKVVQYHSKFPTNYGIPHLFLHGFCFLTLHNLKFLKWLGNTNCNILIVWLSKLPRGLMFTILAWFFDDAIGSVMVMIMVINDDQSWWSWFTMTVLRGYILWSWTTTCYPIPICHQQTTWLPGELAAPPPPPDRTPFTISKAEDCRKTSNLRTRKAPTHWYKYSNNMQTIQLNCPNWTSQSQPP